MCTVILDSSISWRGPSSRIGTASVTMATRAAEWTVADTRLRSREVLVASRRRQEARSPVRIQKVLRTELRCGYEWVAERVALQSHRHEPQGVRHRRSGSNYAGA